MASPPQNADGLPKIDMDALRKSITLPSWFLIQPQTQIWTEKITLKTTQAFVVGGGVGALTGLFLFGTALHTNTNVNYDAPWREQFKQMGKEAKTTVRWWTRTGAVYSGLITGFQAIIDKARGKHDYYGVLGSGVLTSCIVNYGDKPKSVLMAGVGLGLFGVAIEAYMDSNH